MIRFLAAVLLVGAVAYVVATIPFSPRRARVGTVRTE